MKDLTKGFPAKVIILFAIPLMIGNIAQQLYNITDSKIVSMYVGSNALAAVGATGSISNLLIGFINGLTQGFAIVTARNFGAKNEKNLRRAVSGTFLLTAIFTVLLTIIGLFFAKSVLVLLNTPVEILEDAVTYISIIMCGVVFTAIFNMSANTLRAVGDSKRPLYCIFASIFINIVLDILFTGNFRMGIKGVAYATVIAQAVCAFACLAILFIKTKAIIPTKSELVISTEEYMELLSFGLAMGFMGSLVNLGTIILQSAINGLGTIIVTAHIAARRVLDIMMVMVYTIGFSMTTYVSQNYGAGKINRIRQGVKHAILMASAITTVLIVFCYMFGRNLVGWIATSSQSTILDNGEMYLKIGVVCFYALGPLFIYRCSLQGMQSRFAPLLTSTMELIIKILSVLVLVPWLGYLGVALTEPISWIVMTIALIIGYEITIRKLSKSIAPSQKPRHSPLRLRF